MFKVVTNNSNELPFRRRLVRIVIPICDDEYSIWSVFQ